VLDGVAALIQAIKGAIADQIHGQEAASFFGGSEGEGYRFGCHLSFFLFKDIRISS